MQFLKNRYTQLILCLVLGGFLGYSFYPTKTIEERTREEVTEKYESALEEQERVLKSYNQRIVDQLMEERKSSKEYKEEFTKKISTLTRENTKLKQSVKKKRFKLIKPDGTIIEKEFEESDTEQTSSIILSVREEFTRKVSEIENKWKHIHTERIKTIKDYYERELKKKEAKIVYKEKIVEKEKIITVNDKKFRTELGISNENWIYSHTSYTLFGPFVIGAGASFDYSTSTFGDARIGLGIEF